MSVTYIQYGFKRVEIKKLLNVSPFVNIEIEGSGIPFIGYGSAIRRIETKDGQAIFDNPDIPIDYDVRSAEDLSVIKRRLFPPSIVKQQEDERQAYENERAKKEQIARDDVKKNKELLEADPKPKSIDELSTYLDRLFKIKHTYDSSADAVVKALEAVDYLVSEKLGTSGFQMGWAHNRFFMENHDLKSGFLVVNFDDLRYPQKDIMAIVIRGINEVLRDPRFVTETMIMLDEKGDVHPDVKKRWEEIVDGTYHV